MKRHFIPVMHQGRWQVLDTVSRVYYRPATPGWMYCRAWAHKLNMEH